MPKSLSILLLLLTLSALACGTGSLPIDPQAIQGTAKALQPSLEAAAATVQSAAQTAQPSLEAGAATVQAAAKTALPTVQGYVNTALPPALQPGTLIPNALGKLSDEQSVLALEGYARDVFGAPVKVTLGRSLSYNQLNLPDEVEQQTGSSMQLAGTSYFGLTEKGTISLSFGSGSSGGDLVATLQDASLGVLSLQVEQTLPANNDEALALIRATFPGLNSVNLTLVEYTPDSGYRFNNGKAQDWQVQGGQVTLKGSVVNAGVRPVALRSDRVSVWATVAAGTLAAPFLP